MTTTDWTTILEWRLLADSHEFPGPHGGTCINEAAVVAAGFEYRQIDRVEDCPPCFSRFLSACLMVLNDNLDDDARQSLKPFVVRLAGSADTDAVERERARQVALDLARRFGPLVCQRAGAADIEASLSQSETFDEALAALRRGVETIRVDGPGRRSLKQFLGDMLAIGEALDNDACVPARLGERAMDAPSYFVNETGDADALAITLEILESAFSIGAQASPLDAASVLRRMNAAKAAAPITA